MMATVSSKALHATQPGQPPHNQSCHSHILNTEQPCTQPVQLPHTYTIVVYLLHSDLVVYTEKPLTTQAVITQPELLLSPTHTHLVTASVVGRAAIHIGLCGIPFELTQTVQVGLIQQVELVTMGIKRKLFSLKPHATGRPPHTSWKIVLCKHQVLHRKTVQQGSYSAHISKATN